MRLEHMNRLRSRTKSLAWSIFFSLIAKAASFLISRCLYSFHIHVLEFIEFPKMNISKMMSCNKSLLFLEDQDIGDEVLLDRGVVVARPYFSLLILSGACQCIEHYLIASGLYLAAL